MLAIGDYLQNRYRVIRQLGHGGMGTVYEAHDERFENAVALKEVLIDLAKIADPTQQQMVARAFEREAKTLALLHHEAFPHVIDYFSERNHQYLIMELIKGEDLGEQLQSRKHPFEFEEVLDWTKQLLDALDYLHTQEQPIIHRDLKPQNMKITNRGKVKVLDFGIAKGADNKSSSTITNQTFVAATLNYSPIEQLLRVLDPTFREFISQRHKEKVEDILEHTADARSDLYSLGATIYQLLTATQPHDTLKRALDLWAGKPDPLPNPMDLNPKIPPQFNAILLKSMEIDRESRYVSAAEMQEAVKEFLQSPNQGVEQPKPQNAAPEIGMQTQMRIADAERFLAELGTPSAKTEVLSPIAQGLTPPPVQQFIPPVNPDEERRRIAEQQKFLADLDAPTRTEISQTPPPQQGEMTNYGHSISQSNQQDQTNYAINPGMAAGDHTQVSHLANILPAKAADATVINSRPREEAPVQNQATPSATEEKSSNKMMLMVPVGIVGALILVTAIGLGLYFALRTTPSDTPAKSATPYTPSTDPSPAPSVAPSATPLVADTTTDQNSTTSTSSSTSTTSKSTTVNTPKQPEKVATKEEPQQRQTQQQPPQQTTVKPPPTPKQTKPPKGKVILDDIIN